MPFLENETMKEEDKIEFTYKILNQKVQFEDWLVIFFHLNDSLNKKFNSVYQSSYYVKLYELLTEGLEYAKHHMEISKKVQNERLGNWYETLVNGLLNLKKEISEDEFEFIHYKRHHACHIFQDSYEIQLNKKDIINRNKGFELKKQFYSLILIHGTEENFDKYIFKKLNPKIVSIFKQLESI
jgi:hypothetical protein